MDGIAYGIVVLQECSAASELDAAEISWIAFGRQHGWDLTNRTDGGGGQRGYRQSESSKEKRAAKLRGRKHSPERIAKVAAAHRGTKRSDSAREKMRVAKLGRILSEEHKAKIRESHLGRRDRIAAAARRAQDGGVPSLTR